MLKGAQREVIFRMWTRQDDSELIRKKVGACNNNSIGAHYVTRYAADKCGIHVKFTGHLRAASEDPCAVTIWRTDEVPRKKPRTSEEASSMGPLVEQRS